MRILNLSRTREPRNEKKERPQKRRGHAPRAMKCVAKKSSRGKARPRSNVPEVPNKKTKLGEDRTVSGDTKLGSYISDQKKGDQNH